MASDVSRERADVGHALRGVTAIIDASGLEASIFNSQFCGGVLVDPNVVVTAAHCVRNRSAASIHVVVGADNLCLGSRIDGERIAVASISTHPQYDDTTGAYDLARLTLAQPSWHPPREVHRWGGDEANAVALGWGRASVGGVPSCRLSAIPLTIQPDEACASQLANTPARSFEARSMLCAEPRGDSDTCVGDSGGPLILGDDLERGPVIGITSWGIGCGQGYPGVYSRLDTMDDWRAAAGWEGRVREEPTVGDQ